MKKIGRPKQQENRTRRVAASFTEQEFEVLQAKAAAAKITLSDFVYRASLNKEIKVTQQANFEAVRELNSIGKNLNAAIRKTALDQTDYRIVTRFLFELQELKEKWQ